MGVELCYPEAESTSAGVLTLGSQAFSIVFSEAYALILGPSPGGLASNLTMTATLLLGLVCSALLKPDLRRQAAAAATT